jgi:hypothetical protein
MRPLNDTNWHIQFQSDHTELQDSWINIGWYWARPTHISKELFTRSRQLWDQNNSQWDQDVINIVRRQMMVERTLDFPRSIVLSRTDYKTTQWLDWTEIYTDVSKIEAMNQEGVTVHYTAVFNLNKIVLAKHFGHWFNEKYYTQSPKILQPVNVAGNTTEILAQIAFAAYLSKYTGRTFMWPFTVKHVCAEYSGGWKYRPPILIADSQSVADQVSWVEGTYLRNRERFTNIPLQSTTVSLQNVFDEGPASILDFFETCLSAKSDLLMIDFEGLDLKSLWDCDIVRDSIQQIGVDYCRDCALMSTWGSFTHVVC